MRKFVGFFIAGVIGFLIEISAIRIGVDWFDIGPLYPRVVSIPMAIVATWIINRKYTFEVKSEISIGEFVTYASGMAVGIVINAGVYSMLALMNNWFYENPFINLSCSTALSMIFNFWFAKNVAFNKR